MRARPVPDHPISVTVTGDDPRELTVLDVSVGGLGVTPRAGLEPGDEVTLRVELPRFDPIELAAEVRYVLSDAEPVHVGLMLKDAAPEATRALGAYVGELMERGAALRSRTEPPAGGGR